MKIDQEIHKMKILVAEAIKQALCAKSISQAKAVDLVGLNRPDLNQIINRHVERHSLQKLIFVAHKLDCSFELVSN